MPNFQILLLHLDYYLKNKLLKVLELFLWMFVKQTPVNRILIFRNGSLGDSICALPAIQTIREAYPNVVIDVLTNSGGYTEISLGSVMDPKLVNNIYAYEKHLPASLTKQLKNNRYDIFVLLPQAHAPFTKFCKDLLYARLINAKQVFGFTICVTRLFPAIQAKYRSIPNVRDFLLHIANEVAKANAGADLASLRHSVKLQSVPSNVSFPLNITSLHYQKVETLFAEYHITDTSKAIALTIGAKRPQNRWPLAYFDEVIAYLLGQNFQCILIGGKEDTPLVERLTHKNRVIDFTGKLSVMESAAALSKCRMHITNDTGPMHLAYAVGTYVIALFSSRDYPNLWFPPKETSTVFRNNNIHCSECFSITCPHNRCMHKILPTAVIQSFEEVMKSRK